MPRPTERFPAPKWLSGAVSPASVADAAAIRGIEEVQARRRRAQGQRAARGGTQVIGSNGGALDD